MEAQIDLLIDTAIAHGLARFNRYDVGSFNVERDYLPEMTFDKRGLCDVTIRNGNGCAQIRNRKRGPATITFNFYKD